MENNGWAGKPGVPMNPERDGWHWGERDGGLEPRFWSSGQQLWAGSRNSWISPKMLSALFGYAGPCLTPAEVEARVTQAPRDALEEAAHELKERSAFWAERTNHEALIRADECQKIVDVLNAMAKGEDNE